MPESFTQPVNLDRKVTIRLADPAHAILDKELDYTVGSGPDVPYPIDGALSFRGGSATGSARLWHGNQVASWSAGINESVSATTVGVTYVWLAYRDRNGFNLRENSEQLTYFDGIKIRASLGNTYDGGEWAIQGTFGGTGTHQTSFIQQTKGRLTPG